MSGVQQVPGLRDKMPGDAAIQWMSPGEKAFHAKAKTVGKLINWLAGKSARANRYDEDGATQHGLR